MENSACVDLRPSLVVSGTKPVFPVLVTSVFTKRASTAVARRLVVPNGKSCSLAQRELVGDWIDGFIPMGHFERWRGPYLEPDQFSGNPAVFLVFVCHNFGKKLNDV